MRRAIIIAALVAVCGAARAFDASPLLPWVTADSWTPAQLGAKLAVWFDASDGATVLDASGNPATNGAPVQTWSDKSSNGRHATAPAAGQRPSYRTAVQNGRAVVQTDGDDLLEVGSALSIIRNKSYGYVYAVAKDSAPSTLDATHGVLVIRASSGGFWHGVTTRNTAGNTPGAAGRRLNTDTLAAVVGSGGAGHNVICAFADWAGGFLRVSVNGGAKVSTAYASGAGLSQDADSSGAPSLFGQTVTLNEMPANSEIAEVVVVNAAMTDAEIAALTAYLKAKWATP